ncbi:11681_t:CDS:1, partial [Acaulospora colombiana]
TYINSELLHVESMTISDICNDIANPEKNRNDTSFGESSVDERKSASNICNQITTRGSPKILLTSDKGSSVSVIQKDIASIERTSDVSLADKRNLVSDAHRGIASAEKMCHDSFGESSIKLVIDVNSDTEKQGGKDDLFDESFVNKSESMIDGHNDLKGNVERAIRSTDTEGTRKSQKINVQRESRKTLSSITSDSFVEPLAGQRKLANDAGDEVFTGATKAMDYVEDRQLIIENGTAEKNSSEFRKSDLMTFDSFDDNFELDDVTEKYIFSWEKIINNKADERINSTQGMHNRDVSRINADDSCYGETDTYLKKSLSHRTSGELKVEDLFEKESVFGSTTDYTAIVNMDNGQSEIATDRIFRENNDNDISSATNLSIHSSSSGNGKHNVQNTSTSSTFFPLPYAASSPEFSKTNTKPNHLSLNHVVPTTPVKQSRPGVITVEDYLREITEEQTKRLILKTSQMVEELLEVKRKARDAIMSIPVI